MNTTPLVTRRDEGPVAILTLTRPGLHNAFDVEMAEQLTLRLQQADGDPAIAVIVITGDGDKSFSSGANLKDPAVHATTSVVEYLEEMRPGHSRTSRFFEEIINTGKPLIAAVNGYAIGAAFLVCLCCDFVIASDRARFKLPQTSLGLVPAFGGAPRLAQWVGRGRAMDIVLSARFVEAQEAHHIGLVSRLTPPDELMDVTMQVATQLAELPRQAVELTKDSLRQGLENGPLSEASNADLLRFLALSLTEETIGRHESWREQRELVKTETA